MGTSPDVHVRRRRARLARDIVALLGVAPSHVRVFDDSARRYGTSPGDQILVIDQYDPRARFFRLIPEVSHDGLFYLLDFCPDCDAPAVPVAEIAVLHDLGRYLVATGQQGATAIEPDDHAAPPVPDAFYGDPATTRSAPSHATTRTRD